MGTYKFKQRLTKYLKQNLENIPKLLAKELKICRESVQCIVSPILCFDKAGAYLESLQSMIRKKVNMNTNM